MADPPDPARWDIGNPLLDPSPIQLTLTLATNPATGAQALVITARTSTGTLTGTMDKPAAETARAMFDAKIAKMHGLITAPGLAGGHPGNGTPPGRRRR